MRTSSGPSLTRHLEVSILLILSMLVYRAAAVPQHRERLLDRLLHLATRQEASAPPLRRRLHWRPEGGLHQRAGRDVRASKAVKRQQCGQIVSTVSTMLA